MWGLTRAPRLVSLSQNAVFESSLQGRSVVLRVTPRQHRSKDLLEAEIDWLLHLAAAGVPVSPPIPALDGRYVCSDASGAAHHTLFEFAPGQRIADYRTIDDDLGFRWGALLGSMNRISLDFTPPRARRMSFDQRQGIYSLARLEHAKQPHPAVSDTVAWMSQLPRRPDRFGLIHGDLQHLNFHDDGTRLYPFDFDDSCYHWRAYDLAVPLYCLYFDLTFNSTRLATTTFESLKRSMVAGFCSEFPLLAGEQLSADVDRFLIYRVCLVLSWSEAHGEVPDWVTRSSPTWRSRLHDWAEAQLETLWGG